MEKVWKAKDIGLKLYTTKERGWPQNFGYNDLKEGLQNNSYKWTYEDINYSEEQVLYAVVEGNIKLKECWHVVDNDIFRKIRPRCIVERSPLQDRDPRLRKTSQ